MIDAISNNESGLSVRTKLNNIREQFIQNRSGITGTTGGGATKLDGIATVDLDVGEVVRVNLLAIGAEAFFYQLTAGTDAEDDPLIIRPDDYAGGTNEKVWKLSNGKFNELQVYDTAQIDGATGIGASPASEAILNLNSTTQGFYPPRMTTAERDAIGSPGVGLMIYNTSTNQINYYDGSWRAITGIT